MSLRGIVRSIGKAAGQVSRVGTGLATGGLAGGAIAAFSAFGSKKGAGPGPGNAFGGIDIGNPIRMMQGMGVIPAGRGRVAPVNGQCPRGYHLNKAKLADGTQPRSICVRNRSMEPLNGRAAQRAVRRLKKAEKLVRKLKIYSGVRRISSGGSCAPTRGHKPGCGCVVCKR